MNSAQPFVTDFYFGIVIEKFFPILRPVRYDEIGDFLSNYSYQAYVQ